ncbi:hypothetical protein NUU61_002055 [Penicillium alfredii]|uniref:Conidiation-specific protein Con-10 n=1 Tax=Penicillium alfredii TaxID=1506179 RepID=A0A9W9FQV1_9EURO|nr:uncharacterized protein NUU61_002055 [Penicillium alfredii]KAJ5104708.1 hypothetical protein NUU61_002055 [Penicillium alfredii]
MSPLLRLFPAFRPKHLGGWPRRGLAIVAHPHHPNPGNFANRPKEELSEIGHRGGKKGGKARGVGGFHEMDPEKQHAIASKGGRATRKAAIEREAAAIEAEHGPVPTGRSEEPSVVPPGFVEWKTTA